MKNKEKVIELKNVAAIYKRKKSLFKYEDFTALKNITFDVYKGETLGVIGRNGAGKSTLLRLLAGIIKPDRGEIIHHTNSISLMALAAGFDMNLTGRENSIISGMFLGYSKKDMLALVDGIKQSSELQDFFEQPVRTYSSGMKARLAFSVAISASPEVLLIDEALSVGDASFKQKAEALIEEKFNSDITVIIVSHSENQVTRLADRVIWIDAGEVKKEGLPEDIYPEYNLKLGFSTYNINVIEYQPNKDYYIQIFLRKFENNKLLFDCVVISLDDKKINSINVNADNNMLGPSPTPRYEEQYPELNNANFCRFHNGELELDRVNKINLCIEGQHENEVALSVLLRKY
jgi:lipopolysaccharide transport system ATP-binding protein